MRTITLLGGSLLLLVARPLLADQRSPTVAELGVDVVTRHGAPRLLGSVVHRDADGSVTLAASRTWLRDADPKFYEQAVQTEAAEKHQAALELRDRIRVWKKTAAENEKLLFFLEQEEARVEKSLAEPDGKAAPETAQFVLLKLPAARVERVIVQPPQRKQVALVAWREQLGPPETHSVASLTRALRDRGIDITGVSVDLSARIPAARQDAAEWAARQAVVEYQYRRRIDFQGTGDVVTRTDGGAPAADLNELLASMLTSQLKKDLADLLDPPRIEKPTGNPKWLAQATKAAEQAQASGFRVTRLDLGAQQASVETRLVAKLPDGSWQTIWRHVETADTARARPEVEQQIANDPQVRKVLDLARATGLGAEETLQQALRTGAATMAAQQAADARFFEFRDRYLQRLDGPPLRWTDVRP
jgi:hypothetical protein